MITSRCTECGVSSVDGVLTHALTCSSTALKPQYGTEIRPPALELRFDSPQEQQAWLDKFKTGSASDKYLDERGVV